MRRTWIGAWLIALSVGLSAGPLAAQPQNLIIQVAAEPPGLDLTASPASAIAAIIHYNVQECLVKVDRHGTIVPWLAERWHTTDSRNYTFFLKRGVRFHNGRELKAGDESGEFLGRKVSNDPVRGPRPRSALWTSLERAILVLPGRR